MKKLSALLLSMIMAVSLAVPAFAAEADAGYTVDGEPVPTLQAGDPIPKLLFPPAEAPTRASVGIIGGADGPTSIITSGPLESFDLEGMDPESFDWSMMDQQIQEMAQKQRNTIKESMGGVPGQVGVMVNGKYIQFPDAAPETVDGRTMAPVRALVEALDGQIDYQDGTVTFTVDGYAYAFAIGSTTVKVSVTAGNDKDTPKPEDIEMDCAPYLKDGRTYVPIRFIAEALGYDVGWDHGYETVILLDRDAMAAKINESFVIMNKVQANRGPVLEEGKDYRTDLKGSVTVTAFDTLNGNKTYKADFTGKELFNTKTASGELSLKLSDNILKDLDKMLADMYGEAFEEDAALLHTVVEGLTEMELIFNREGKIWFHAPVLDELAGEENVWVTLDAGAEQGAMAFTSAGDATVGEVLAAMVDTDYVETWFATNMMVKFMAELYGDDKFTTKDGVSTATIGVDELAAVYEIMMGDDEALDEAMDVFEDYTITVKVDSDGAADVTCRMETKPQSGVPAVKMTMDASQAAGRASVSMDLHIANLGEMKLTLDAQQKTTAEKPLSEPPAGATVVDAPELLDF